MNETSERRLRGLGLPSGVGHYRAFVGQPELYDRIAALQFALLCLLGLRDQHFLLDIGCGSLRGGKLFIPYLLPGRYYGIEPEAWLIQEGIRNELGEGILALKRPSFSNDREFTLSAFGRRFDYLLAQSIFSHASQAQIRRCLGEASKIMEPTSLFAFTFFVGKEDYGGDRWVYPDVTRYTLSRIQELIREQGMEGQRIDWPHPAGQTWMLAGFPDAMRKHAKTVHLVSRAGRLLRPRRRRYPSLLIRVLQAARRVGAPRAPAP